MSRKYASTFAQNAKNMSGYSRTRQEFCRIGLHGAGAGGDRTIQPAIPEWKKVYLKEAEQRRLLHQARVLGWGKEKRYYYAHKIN